ncbi:MAG: right-handed parallel beta-helix repeat-containing protein [Bacteroidales bacterium]|nr:right-handed parallel beta-helix repeat-containing protein [Bacteroidales bacterium]
MFKQNIFYKRVIIVFVILLFLTAKHNFSQNCDHLISSGTTLVDGTGLIYPGDTVCLQAGQKDYLLLRNIHGTEEQPVVILNKDGKVVIDTDHFYGIKFAACSFVKFSGNGSEANQYGILVSRVENGAGISVDNKSTNIEIEYTEISNTLISGIVAKTEPDPYGDCTFPAVRDSFTMYNIIIHDNYLHNIGNEGMYIGSSKYTGQEIYHCDTTVLPHVLMGVKVYNNILENIGWDGIQVSSAVSDCEIFGNYIFHDSNEEEQWQMSGILIGGGSNCDCYNNTIIDGKGDGIDLLGLGDNRIFNNLIVNPGKTYYPNQPPTEYQKHGIWTGDIVTNQGTDFLIYNNTIISPRTFGIKLSNSSVTDNKIYNNIIVDPGAYNLVGDDAYINRTSTYININLSNNFLNPLVNSVQFIDPANSNYDLQINSPAINGGKDLSFLGLDFDIENRLRPYYLYYDIGAYECQDSTLSIDPIEEVKDGIILRNNYPNPFRNKTSIKFYLPEKSHIIISLFDKKGIMLKELLNKNMHKGEHKIKFDAKNLAKGTYFYTLSTNKNSLTKKMTIF